MLRIRTMDYMKNNFFFKWKVQLITDYITEKIA